MSTAAATLNAGAGVWLLVNMIQVARTTTLFTSKQNQQIRDFLNADFEIVGLNFEFVNDFVKKGFEFAGVTHTAISE